MQLIVRAMTVVSCLTSVFLLSGMRRRPFSAIILAPHDHDSIGAQWHVGRALH